MSTCGNYICFTYECFCQQVENRHPCSTLALVYMEAQYVLVACYQQLCTMLSSGCLSAAGLQASEPQDGLLTVQGLQHTLAGGLGVSEPFSECNVFCKRHVEDLPHFLVM